MPAQVPHTALPFLPSLASRTNSLKGSRRPPCWRRRSIVVDSPPGRIRAETRERSWAVRMAVAMMGCVGVERDERRRMCSANEPWRALVRLD